MTTDTKLTWSDFDYDRNGREQTAEYRGLTIRLVNDEEPMNPRDWDNLGTLFIPSSGQFIEHDEGDDRSAWEDVDYAAFLRYLKNEKGARVILPVFRFEHSSVAYSTGSFNDPWDSGQVGVIYATAKDIREAFMVKRITASVAEKARDCLTSEVDVYSMWANGDAYGYVIENENGDSLDSCFGYYGIDDVIENAQWSADHEADAIENERAAEDFQARAESAVYGTMAA